MKTNLQLAEIVLSELLATGVREICLCAGARNSPFVVLLDGLFPFRIYNFFEERSASFFALGRVVTSRRPVAVITTSGTAVGELLPAAIEATYSSLPLIMVSADRPKSFRSSGSPQTIEQIGIFSYYIEATFDLDQENSHFSLKALSWKKPVHVNVCFQEPLLDSPVPTAISNFSTERRIKLSRTSGDEDTKLIEEFAKTHTPLVIVSSLPEKSRVPMAKYLKTLNCPMYLEGPSGLRGHPDLKDKTLFGGDAMLKRVITSEHCSGILRIGGIPTTRVWRDLEDEFAKFPVLSVGYNHFTGLSREISHFTSIANFLKMEVAFKNPNLESILSRDRSVRKVYLELLEKYPESEHSYMRRVSELAKNDSVFIGNSLPIREWDIAANEDYCPARIAASRGANGIDGQVSTFLGWTEGDRPHWCIVGDLTALYDMTAPWIYPQIKSKDISIVVINNSGGRIFERMFNREIFVNQHDIEFSHWAKMWKWSYQLLTRGTSLQNQNDRPQIIEVRPDGNETRLLLDEWEAYWLSL